MPVFQLHAMTCRFGKFQREYKLCIDLESGKKCSIKLQKREDRENSIKIYNWEYQLYFLIFHFKLGISIVLFIFSIAKNVEAHTIQYEPIQGHEVHDVATTGKKHLCNIFLMKNQSL